MDIKMLLIDDDLDDREFFCDAIDELDQGVVCYSASSGRKALAKLNNGEIELPNIIFLDVNMPPLSGWDCLAELKAHEQYKHIPVVMYSTSSNESDIDKASRLGALCFFTKPLYFKELKKSLEIVIQHLRSDSLSTLMLASPVFTISPA